MYLQEINTDSISELKSDSVFSSAAWLQIYPRQKLTLVGIFDDNKKLQGYFFHYNQKQLKVLNHINLPPYSPHNGLTLHDNTQNKANKLSFYKKIMTLIAEYYNSSKASIITLAFPAHYIDMQPFTWNKYKVIPFYTYTVNLQKTEEEIYNNVSSKTRNLIKKATKDGLTVSRTNNYTPIEEIVQKTMHRNKVQLDKGLLKKILFGFANANNSFSYIVEHNNKVIAATFCIMDEHSCYYLLGGYDENNAHPGAGPLAVWNSIVEAKKLNRYIFDFEGSMLQPVESYFRSFGGDLTPYYSINKGKMLTEILLKFKKRGQF